ncbi:MAG: DUF1849 family protein [Rhodospirillales bacterium]|nr:DUF1849 family protein [Rhodospirillales bacterium]
MGVVDFDIWRHPLKSGAIAALTVLLAAPASDAATIREPDTTFKSHRVLYDMVLRSAESGSNVADAKGTMYYRFEALCDGWEVESRVALRLHYGRVGSAEVVETTWTFSSFEDYDGDHLTYAVDHKRDGVLVEAFAGEAGKDKTGGFASFNDDETSAVDLPVGTLFPAEHLKRMMDHAKQTGGAFKQVVFDGASVDNPYEVNAFVIGPVRDSKLLAKGDDHARKPVFVGATSTRPIDDAWRIRMAYFPLFTPKTLPEFEIEVDYRENGIAERMVQDFGDFSLNLTPSRLEMLPLRTCE